MEVTACRHVGRRGRFARQDVHDLSGDGVNVADLVISARHRQQCLGVGMGRRGYEVLARSKLDDATK